jgi:hypothetical protein
LTPQTIPAGGSWSTPDLVLKLKSPYPIPLSEHYNRFVVRFGKNDSAYLLTGSCEPYPGVVNETLHVWDELTVPDGFTVTPMTYNPSKPDPYPVVNNDYGNYWATVNASNTLTLSLSITNQSATDGPHELSNVCHGTNECGNWESGFPITLHVNPPPNGGPWVGYTLTHGYWKNHPLAYVNWLPVTIAGVTVSTTSQGHDILSRSGNSSSPWNKFLCHFLAATFNNLLNNGGLLNAYYNDMAQTGEYMEGQQISYIFGLANSFSSSTPSSTLLAMKDVCDAMNQDHQNVLWTTPGGGSGKTISLPTSSFFTLNPNPFDNRTEIRFLTENKEPVTLSVYDVSGAKVRDLVKNGNSTLYWDGTDNNGKKLTHGVYIIRANNTTLKALISR